MNERQRPIRRRGALAAAVLLLAAGGGIGGANAEGNPMNPNVIHVQQFDAVPNDGLDDAPAIQAALQEAAGRKGATVVQFGEGVYNLREAAAENAMLVLADAHHVTLMGAATPEGEPATVLQVNLELANDVTGQAGAGHLIVERSKKVKLQNLILDYGPRFASAGVIVEVDRNADRVVVDVFPGMPHFEGMRAYSANSWDLDTKLLLPVDALTIGTDQDQFTKTWKHVPGQPENRYEIVGMGFSDRVEPGQGISWHFNVEANPNLQIMHSQNIVLENIRIYNSLGMSALAGYNKNITLKDVRVEPEGNSLAVGPRDAFHFSNNSGSLLADNILIKGVRWDPFVSRTTFIEVTEVLDDRRIETSYAVGTLEFRPGDTIRFWVGEQPFERQIESVQSVSERVNVLSFADPLPGDVKAGSRLTHSGYEWDEAVIRNSVFEGNFGTPLILTTPRMTIENNVFRNNAYSNIGLGPTSVNTGGFVRDVVIRGNVFEQSTWIQKYNNYDGTITLFENHPSFANEKYNENITITGNTFKDLDIGDHAAAVHVKNARNVELSGNTYINVNHPIKVYVPSTENVVNLDGVPVTEEFGDAPLPPGAVAVGLNDAGYAEAGGTWLMSGLTGYAGSTSRYSGAAGAVATWTPDLQPGTYRVLAYRIVHPSSEPATKLEVHHRDGVAEVVSDYTAGSSGWLDLGTYEFDGGSSGFVRLSRANADEAVGYVRTNAVAFVPVAD